MMSKGRLAVAAGAALATALSIGLAAADAPRSYTWYAELVGVDQSTKTLTARAQIKSGVKTYVGSYKPGDKLMIVWAPVKAETDSIVYAPKIEVMKGVDEGYILPAEFVSADVANNTLTFKTAAPDSVLQGVGKAKTGSWIKVTTPMQQPKEVAQLASAESTTKPDLQPNPPPPMPAAGGRGRAAAGAAQAASIVGTWTVNANVMGMPVSAECKIAQQGVTLSGDCTPQGGKSSPLTGELKGKQVTFGYTVNFSGMDLNFGFIGDLEGPTMKGTVTIYGITADFTATKKEG